MNNETGVHSENVITSDKCAGGDGYYDTVYLNYFPSSYSRDAAAAAAESSLSHSHDRRVVHRIA